MLKFPLLLVNFKTYREASGEKALKLSRLVEKIAKKHEVGAAIAAQAFDIARIAKAVKIPVLSQHCDPFEPGAHTGAITAEGIKLSGGKGSLLNHSEKRIDLQTLKECIAILRKNRLLSIACSPHARLAILIEGLKPDFLAIEPPELIGSGVAVSKAKPELIEETTRNVKLPVLCGAGITSGEDCERAIRLGTKGVLVSSAIALSKNQKKAIEEIALGLRKGWLKRKQH